jgi:hypothetical protein
MLFDGMLNCDQVPLTVKGNVSGNYDNGNLPVIEDIKVFIGKIEITSELTKEDIKIIKRNYIREVGFNFS